jgi:amino acid adenylation domain-containing protein
MSEPLENVVDVYPLSSLQKGMLYHSLSDQGSGVYIEQLAINIESDGFDLSRFKQSWVLLVERHEALRTAFVWEGLDQPLQVVHGHVDLIWKAINLSANKTAEVDRILGDFEESDSLNEFRLNIAPVMRMTVFQLPGNRTRWYWTRHHMLADGWSTSIILQELKQIYNSLANGTEISLPAAGSYRKHIDWLQEKGCQQESDRQFWIDYLGFNPEKTDILLPDCGEKGNVSLGHGRINFKLGVDANSALQGVCKQLNVTLNTIVQACWAVLLSRCSTAQQVVWGSVYSGRAHAVAGVESTVGLFINSVPLSARLDANTTTADFLRNLNSDILTVMEHEHCSLSDIQNWCESPAVNGLFDSVVVFENYPAQQPLSGGLHLAAPEYNEKSNLPLALLAIPAKRLECILIHDRNLVGDVLANRILGYMHTLLEALPENLQTVVGNLPMIGNQELSLIQAYSNSPGKDSKCQEPDNMLVDEMILHQCRSTPNAMAVSFGKQTLTYAQLDALSEKHAEILRHTGVNPGDPVVLCLGRGASLIAWMLAVLRTGAPYVIVDSGIAESIQVQRSKAAGAGLIVTECEPSDTLRASGIMCLNMTSGAISGKTGSAVFPRSTNDPAYILFTSGSTGSAKGVVVSHANLRASTVARYHEYESPPESFLLLSAMFFDSAVAGIFWTLTTGGKLVISENRAEQDIDNLVGLFSNQRITHTLCLPGLYRVLLEHVQLTNKVEALQHLNTVICAGESLDRECVSRHQQMFGNRIRLFNEYGPTEATVWCTVYEATEHRPIKPVPIGYPVYGYTVLILDRFLQPAPLGVPGQIAVAGPGVALGYLNGTQQSGAAFLDDLDLFGQNIRLYLTGDLACYDQNRAIEFLGRKDSQVKIRGYRVEPEEIEYHLRRAPGVEDAAVISVDKNGASSGGPQLALIALLLGELPDGRTAELSAHLQQNLPDYMVPEMFQSVESLPRLDNGKLDRKRLLSDFRERTEQTRQQAQSIEPASLHTDAEHLLASIWMSVLGVLSVDRESDFFRIGGDSIQTIRVLSQLASKGYQLAPGDLFEYPVLRELAERLISLEGLEQKNTNGAHSDSRAMSFALTDSQSAYMFSHLRQDIPDPGHIQIIAELQGQLENEVLTSCLDICVAQHPALRGSINTDSNGISSQTFHRDLVPDIRFVDSTPENIKQDVRRLCEELRKSRLDLNTPAHWSINIFSESAREHVVVASFHHVFIDGWSAATVIGQLIQKYNNQCKDTTTPLRTDPVPGFEQYLQWLASQKIDELRTRVLDGLRPIMEDQETASYLRHRVEDYSSQQSGSLIVEGDQLINIQNRLKSEGHSIGELVYAAWAYCLSGASAERRVAFHVTVSGRNVPVAGIESMIGQFVNHLPVSLLFPEESSLDNTLSLFKRNSVFLQRYQYVSASIIEKWTRQPVGTVVRRDGENIRIPSLVMVENFPWQTAETSAEDCLILKSFQRRGVSKNFSEQGAISSFPLTIVAAPDGDRLQLQIGFNSTYFDAVAAQSLLEAFSKAIINWGNHDDRCDRTLWRASESFLSTSMQNQSTSIAKSNIAAFSAPETEMEHQLTAIWQAILKQNEFGIDESFFNLGGTSLSASSMVEAISDQTGNDIPLALLIEHHTIRALARYLEGKPAREFSSLVAIQSGGNQRPVFGIHAEGNVLFYRDLARLLGEDQPFYGLQSRELGGSGGSFASIAEMAGFYLQEIRKVQPEGPYIICGMCFGGWIAFEMAQQLKKQGQEVDHLFIFDSGGPVLRDDNDLRFSFKRVSLFLGSKRALVSPLHAVRRLFLSPRKRQHKRIMQNHRFLKRNYRASEYDGEIVFLRSEEWNKIPKFQRHIDRWERLTNRALKMHLVKGEHGNILETPQVYETAKIMHAYLKGDI